MNIQFYIFLFILCEVMRNFVAVRKYLVVEVTVPVVESRNMQFVCSRQTVARRS